MNGAEVFSRLFASGPDPDYADELMLYGRLVGSWNVEATRYERGEITGTSPGEWHFAWVLGGRGIQDVLFRTGADATQWGVTLRCFDPDEAVWHVSWMQPAAGEFANLLGVRAGDEIVQESVGDDPRRRERWSFTEIADDSFRWLAEASYDEGATWSLEQEIVARRMAAPNVGG